MIVIDDTQRRARLVQRHLLSRATAAPDPVGATRALVALHSTDPASVYLSASCRGVPAEQLEDALYGTRSLVRMLAMRRTVFVVPTDAAPVVHAAATRAIASRERGRLIGYIEENGLTKDGSTMLTRLEEAALAVVTRRGEVYGTEVGEAVPGLRQQITIAGGAQSLTSRVLFILAAEGRIVRGRPRGSWISSQYSWSPAPIPPPTPEQLPTAQAQIELAEAYLRAYGPAGVADLQWWTGWTAGETKKALAGLDTTSVALADGTGVMLADDTALQDDPEPTAHLLPALDPSVMGWKKRDFFLDPEHCKPAAVQSLFDRSGNPGPTVWWGGRVVGGWAQRKDGEVLTQLLTSVSKGAQKAIAQEAERTAAAIGSARVTPRFRTPLERELAA